MKLITDKGFLLIILACLLAMTASLSMAQVYKVVDEHGNVTFTDIPPPDGSAPVDLPPISVVETPVYQQTAREADAAAVAAAAAAAAAGGADVAVEEPKELTLRELRQNYKDFAIISPQWEESLWGPEGPVTVAWRTSNDLEEGMQVSVFIDGTLEVTTTQSIIPIGGLERGEHIVTAEIKDQRNRKIATAGPVTFFIRQPGLFNGGGNRPVPTPHGGG